MAAHLLLAMVVAGLPIAVTANDSPGRQVLLSIKVFEQPTRSKPGTVLTNPTIVSIIGRPFSVNAGGGTIKPKSSDDDLFFGTRSSGVVNEAADGKFRIAVKVELGKIVPQPDDAETGLVQTDALDIRTVVRAGETKRIKVSPTRWCELRAEEVQPLINADQR